MMTAGIAFRISREEVEGLRYLKNPRTAAQYLGIPQAQVEDVWAEMVEPRKSHSGQPSYSDPNAGIGAADWSMTSRDLATTGSDNLKQATIAAMLRWADCNGTTIDRAAKFLLSGVGR